MSVKPASHQCWDFSTAVFIPPLKSHPLSPSFHPLLSVVCVCLYQWQGRLDVCSRSHFMRVCVCQMINLHLAGSRESRCMWHSARHSVLGCVLFDTVSNPASPLVLLQECCEHTGFSFSPCFLYVLTEDLPSCLTDWLTDFQLSLCRVVLAEVRLSFSVSYIGLFDVVCVFFIFWHPPLPPSSSSNTVRAGGRSAVSASVCPHSVYPPSRPSIWSQLNYGHVICANVFLPFHTNPFSPSLTDSPLTGWTIHRWLMDTKAYWHSQRSCCKNINFVLNIL